MAESFAKLLECSICLEQMVVPKILPCFHTFCLACLCKIEPNVKTLQCPECRKEHDLPINGAKGFNNNFRLSNLIDDLSQAPVTSTPPLDQLEGQHVVLDYKLLLLLLYHFSLYIICTCFFSWMNSENSP